VGRGRFDSALTPSLLPSIIKGSERMTLQIAPEDVAMADDARVVEGVRGILGEESAGGGSMGMAAMGAPAMAPAARNGALGITNIGAEIALPTTTLAKPLARSYERYRVSVREYVS